MNNQSNELPALPIVIDGKEFHAGADRMWSLNEIHRELGLPDNKRPSEWNNQVKDALANSGNFRSSIGIQGGTWATEKGTIAYAMWVSTEFYEKVVDAYVLMRNDLILRERVAILQLAEKTAVIDKLEPASDVFFDRLRNGGAAPWSACCKSLRLPPNLLKEGLLRSGKFTTKFCHDRGDDVIVPHASGFKLGLFVTDTSLYGRESWKVTAKGYAWMQENAARWSEILERDKQAKAAATRVKKKATAVKPWVAPK
ncbi:KilA-N domain-containing protein [Serratia marcescens]|uniref:KilA-N domain-containing protein n=1 Tax=Serratia marcescens TaxID=615 RepID=UPI003FA7084B